MQDVPADSPASAAAGPANPPRVFDRIGGWLVIPIGLSLLFTLNGARMLYHAVTFDTTSIEFEYYSMTDVLLNAVGGVVSLAGWPLCFYFALRRDTRFAKLFTVMMCFAALLFAAKRLVDTDEPALTGRLADVFIYWVFAAGNIAYVLLSKRVAATFEGVPYMPTLTDAHGQVDYLQALLWGANFSAVMIAANFFASAVERDWSTLTLRAFAFDLALTVLFALAGASFVVFAFLINLARRHWPRDPSQYRL